MGRKMEKKPGLRTCGICEQKRKCSRSKISPTLLQNTDFYERCRVACHLHFVEAVKFILAKMNMSSVCCNDGLAYVTPSYIPSHVVTWINIAISLIDKSLVLTDRNVWDFFNEAMKRYHSTPFWLQAPDVDPLVAEEDNAAENDAATNYPTLALENLIDGEALQAEHLILEQDVKVKEEPACLTDGESLEVEKTCDMTANEYICGDDYNICSTSTDTQSQQQTDPPKLQQLFLVRGEMLLRLFKFCPECGHKLRSAQLTERGTAAVVKYICGNCCMNSCSPRQWDSQKNKQPQVAEANGTAVVLFSAAETDQKKEHEMSHSDCWALKINH